MKEQEMARILAYTRSKNEFQNWQANQISSKNLKNGVWNHFRTDKPIESKKFQRDLKKYTNGLVFF